MIYGDRNWDIMSLEYPGKRAMDWEGHEGFFLLMEMLYIVVWVMFKNIYTYVKILASCSVMISVFYL